MVRIVRPDSSTTPHFRLRGQSMTRMETFVDAAFAFSVTMLVISVDNRICQPVGFSAKRVIGMLIPVVCNAVVEFRMWISEFLFSPVWNAMSSSGKNSFPLLSPWREIEKETKEVTTTVFSKLLCS